MNQRDLKNPVLTRRPHGSRPNSNRRQGVLLLDSAEVRLAPGVVVEATGLKDMYSGDAYTLNPVGRYVAAQLDAGVSVRDLTQSIARTYATDEDSVRPDLQRFISVLHSRQLLSIRQSYLAEIGVRIQLILSLLVSLPTASRYLGKHSPYRRYPAKATSLLAASLKAHQPTAAIALLLLLAIEPVIFLPLLRQGSLPSIPMALSAAQPLIAYALVFVGSIGLHEFIHYWAARRLRVPLRSVYVAPGRIGVSQVDVRSKRNGIVSTAGPAGTVFVLLLLALLTPSLHLPYPFAGVAAPTFFSAVAVVHLFGLTPLTSDGKQFFKLIGLA